MLDADAIETEIAEMKAKAAPEYCRRSREAIEQTGSDAKLVAYPVVPGPPIFGGLSGDRTALQGRREDIVAHGVGEAARPARFEQEAILGCMSDRGLAIGCLVDSRPRGSTLGQAYHI
jgi:hypothetical protein